MKLLVKLNLHILNSFLNSLNQIAEEDNEN